MPRHPDRENSQFNPELSPEERFRSVIDPEVIKDPYNRFLFEYLFQDTDPVKSFNHQSVRHLPETHPSEEQKQAWRAVLAEIGYVSPDKKWPHRPYDRPELHVAFSDDPQAYTRRLLSLPILAHLSGVGQTDFGPSSRLPLLYNNLREQISRLDHTVSLGYEVMKTYFRLAIMQPDLMAERIVTDLARYGQIFLSYPQAFMHGVFGSINEGEYNYKAVVREYAKYNLLAVYLHDAPTPALGDTLMKTRIEVNGRMVPAFSEDEALAKSIRCLVDDPATGLPQLIADFQLDQDLVVTMVRSLSTEGDVCLPGYLFKDKRKIGSEWERMLPFKKTNGAAYDHDQENGTTINVEYLATKYLPGGHRYLRKEGDLPIGSFEERVRLLFFALLTDLPKEKLAQMLRRVGVDPKKVFLAKEEYSIVHNIALRKVPFTNRGGEADYEIMPVPLDPGDVKKALTLFYALQLFYYASSRRQAHEAFVQSLFSALWDRDGNGQKPLSMDLFIGKTDAQALEALGRISPALRKLIQLTKRSGVIMTGEQVEKLNENYPIDQFFVRKVNYPRKPDIKSGTFTQAVDGIRFAGTVLARRINKNSGDIEPNEGSVIKRFTELNKYIQDGERYFVVFLTPKIKSAVERLYQELPGMTGFLNQVISDWRSE